MKFSLVMGVSLAIFASARHVAAANPLAGQLKWRVPVESILSAGPILGTRELIYGVARPGETFLYAWEAGTGETRWMVNLGQVAFSGPGNLLVGPEGNVYVRSSTGLRALDGESGRELWTTSAQGLMAVGADGVIYVVSSEVHALEPARGAVRWSSLTGPGDFGPPVVTANGLLIFLADQGKHGAQAVVAWDTRDGRPNWRFEPPPGGLEGFTSIILAGEGTILATGQSGEIYALDEATGAKLWNVQGPERISDLIVGPAGTVAVAQDGLIDFREIKTGELNRRMRFPFVQGLQLALASDDTLYVAAYEYLLESQRLLALNYLTGQTNWTFEPTSYHVRGLNLGADGTVYFEGETLYAIEGGSPLADSAWPKAQQNAQGSSYWKMTGAPRFTQQPKSHWAAAGRSTTFHYYGPGARPLSIQWRFNGQPIPGATNETLLIRSVQFADAGRYSVALNNPLGTALSDEATLEVGYALEVTTTGPGAVERTPDLEIYPANSIVEMRAVTVRSNHTFVGWSGDVTSSARTISVPLATNQTVTARFEFLYPDVKWSAGFKDAPALGTNGILYAFQGDSVAAFHTDTGSNLWTAGYLDGWWAPPALGPDGTVYIGNYGGSSVWAYDGQTGEARWAFNIGVCVHSCPTLGLDGTLYLGGTKLYAVDSTTHREKWSFAGASIFESSPALSADAVLYAGCYDGKLYALDAISGTKLWEFLTEGAVHSSPALGADGTVYFGSEDGKVYALDGKTGGKRWAFATKDAVTASPVIGPDGSIYIGSTDNSIYALNGQTGSLRWRFHTGRRVQATAALAADGILYVGPAGGSLYALDSQTGRALWTFGPAGTPAIGPDGTIYCAGFAYHGTSPLATSPWPKFHRDPTNRGRAPARPWLDAARSHFTPNGFELIAYGEPGQTLRFEWTVDWVEWNPLGTVANQTGTVQFLDGSAGPAPRHRFYRSGQVP